MFLYTTKHNSAFFLVNLKNLIFPSHNVINHDLPRHHTIYLFLMLNDDFHVFLNSDRQDVCT